MHKNCFISTNFKIINLVRAFVQRQIVENNIRQLESLEQSQFVKKFTYFFYQIRKYASIY